LLSGIPDVGRVLQKVAFVLLACVACAAMHGLIFHLHFVLAPFALSGFLVFAVEPYVDAVYQWLAGIAPPYRWCGCLWLRRRHPAQQASGTEEPSGAAASSQVLDGETEVLLDSDSLDYWRSELACRAIAVTGVVAASVLIGVLFVVLVVTGAGRVHDNWGEYQRGSERMAATLQELWTSWQGKTDKHHIDKVDQHFKATYTQLLTYLQDGIWALVTYLLHGLSGSITYIAIVVLYVVFWLSHPLPGIGGPAGMLVRSYLWKKLLSSLCYGVCVAVLFFALGIDLAAFFGALSFLLNFVPEVGALIAIVAPAPMILLDGRIESPFLTLGVATLGQLVLKFLFGNILEVKLIENDAEMSIHPVWVILGLNYFGYVWGATGMLITVPTMALLKGGAVSVSESGDPAFADWGDFVFHCLEGRLGKRGGSSALADRAVPLPEAPKLLSNAVQEPADGIAAHAPV